MCIRDRNYINKIKINRIDFSTYEIVAFKNSNQTSFGVLSFQKAKYVLIKAFLKTPGEHFILGKGFPIEFQILGKLIPDENPQVYKLHKSKQNPEIILRNV